MAPSPDATRSQPAATAPATCSRYWEASRSNTSLLGQVAPILIMLMRSPLRHYGGRFVWGAAPTPQTVAASHATNWRSIAEVADDVQMAEDNQGSRDDPAAWLADRELLDHSVRDPWEAPVGDGSIGAAQREYDSTPELRDLLARAASGRSVIRSRHKRKCEPGSTRE